jgi:predicted nucleotidyltransferase
MGEGEARRALRSQEEMLQRARRFVERAAKRLKLLEAYIVGSRARGDCLDESGIDVVLVARGVNV